MRLAIITTHPIQYYAPLFKLLQQRHRLSIKVFYTWGENAKNKFDPGFDKNIEWDIPLMEGYLFEWVINSAADPGTHHFKGIINPFLTDQINEWQPDAILIYGWGFNGHLKALRYFKGKVPVYFRGDSTLLDEKSGLKNWLRPVFLKWIYRYVDHAFFVGKNNKAYFKQYGLKDNELSFAPHAVDNERFAVPRDEEVHEFRRQLNIKDNDILITFAAKLEEKKDPSVLLKAFSSLNLPNVHLLFVGNGPLESILKQSAGNNANVHFMDFQNQSVMPIVLQACDLFCLPSKGPGETWGLAVNEAMACGKTVLVSDKTGCAADLVKNGVNGYIFKAGNVHDLSQKLKQLSADKSQLLKYGEQSRIIIKDWNFTNMARAIENKILNETD